MELAIEEVHCAVLFHVSQVKPCCEPEECEIFIKNNTCSTRDKVAEELNMLGIKRDPTMLKHLSATWQTLKLFSSNWKKAPVTC